VVVILLSKGGRGLSKRNTNDVRARKEVEVDQRKNGYNPSVSPPESTSFTAFPIVGIGASAGGLEAFTALLENLPTETGIAFIFIQHLASGESMLTDILSRSTSMPVHTIRNNMTVEGNHVYVIPPDKNMTISQDILHLKRKRSTQHRPIDEFLVSLAHDRKNLAIGVILSGTGTDGTEGLKAIYAEGGITFAQDEQSAKYPGMPHSAAASGGVVFILPPKKIAEELVTISRHPRLNHVEKRPVETPEVPTEEDDIRSILSLLKLTFHVDFNQYKASTLNRRIGRRMVIHKIESVRDYVTILRTHAEEQQALYEDLLINVTSFFREPETFQVLVDTVLPEIMKDRPPDTTIRIWVPGCASGEEVYSIAICLREYFDTTRVRAPVQIFGTDINDTNIVKARAGVYAESIVVEVSEARLRRFFTRIDRNYQIIKPLRDMCIFARQDLVTDPPFSNLDMVSCRNVMIYFKPEVQKKILPIFHYALKPRGFLILGVSESIGPFGHLFAPVDGKRGPVYIRKLGPTKITFSTEPSFELVGRIGAKTLPTPEKPLAVVKREVDHILMAKYLPSSVIIDADMNIILFRGDMGPFLSPMPGEASLNLTKVVRSELRVEAQTAFYIARKQETSVRRERLEFQSNGHTRSVNVEVMPLKRSESEEKFFLVIFKETTPLSEAAVGQMSMRSTVAEESLKNRQIKELSNELASTKESLQTIIEEQESTNEELRSASEEVQSSNEELQSTNEELETAKEELQSTNEELNTLNEELAIRNREISRSVNDLNNVFNNTNVAILILDVELRIRLFTPAAEKLFNLIPSDINRPLRDLRLGIKVPNLLREVNRVIDELVSVEREVQTEEGTWCQMRIRPYLTSEKKIDGIVLSFVDITEIFHNQRELEDMAKFPSENPYPVMRINKNGFFMYCNGAAKQILESLKCKTGEVIPERWRTFVDESFDARKKQEFEEHIGGRTFIFVMSPVIDYVNVYGHDITERKKAEEELLQIQNRLSVATKAAKIGIHDYDIVANTVQWDERIREIWGVEPDEPITYETFIENVHPDDRAAVQTEMDKALDPKRGDFYAEYRVINRKNKAVRWVYATGKTFFDDNYNALRLIGTAEDITERKKAEEVLRQQAQLLHLSYDAIVVWRKEGGIEHWNRGAEQLYGYAESEARGRVPHKLLKTIHPVPWPEIEAAMRKHGQWEGELRHYAKDGHEVTVLTRHQLVRGTDGIERILETNRDITERKKWEDKLEHAMSTLERERDILQTVMNGARKIHLVYLDRNFNFVRVNEEYAKTCGYTPNEMIGKNHFVLYPNEENEAIFKRVRDTGVTAQFHDKPFEFTNQPERGVTYWDWTLEPIKAKTGMVEGLVFSLVETTDRKKMEDTIRARVKEAERLAAIGATAGMVGHDIRNPLQSIESAIYLGKDDVNNSSLSDQEKASMNEMFDAIKEQTNYINKIVSDLQDFAHPVTPEKIETNTQQFLEGILASFHFSQNIEVAINVSDNLPQVTIDPDMMRRVLVNLITNSLQAMSTEGKLTINAFRKGNFAYLSVQDTGTGIPEAVKPKLFEPMFTTKSKGQGFGLAVCKKIVEAHHGTITFNSEGENSTVFTIQIPLT
jgi:PAS domain S-box-containing protein